MKEKFIKKKNIHYFNKKKLGKLIFRSQFPVSKLISSLNTTQ